MSTNLIEKLYNKLIKELYDKVSKQLYDTFKCLAQTFEFTIDFAEIKSKFASIVCLENIYDMVELFENKCNDFINEKYNDKPIQHISRVFSNIIRYLISECIDEETFKFRFMHKYNITEKEFKARYKNRDEITESVLKNMKVSKYDVFNDLCCMREENVNFDQEITEYYDSIINTYFEHMMSDESETNSLSE